MPFAVAAGAVVAAGASVYAANSAADTADKQINATKDAQAAAAARLQPYSDVGLSAFQASGDLAGLNGADAQAKARDGFMTSPGYEFAMSEGLRAVDASAAGKGILRSGATLKAEQAYGSGLASQEFGKYVNNLNTLAKFGESAASGQAVTDTSAGGNLANIYGQEGTSTNKALQTGTSSVGGLLADKDFRNALSGYFSSGSSAGTSGFQTGAGGANSSGANTLQDLGFYTPLPNS